MIQTHDEPRQVLPGFIVCLYRILMLRDILGAFSPLAIDTEKAPIARPTPGSMLLITKETSVSI